MTAAYADLREAGFLDSIRGSGSVARLPHAARGAPEDATPDFLDFSKATLPRTRCGRGRQRRRRAAARLPRRVRVRPGRASAAPPGDRGALHARGLPTDADEILVTIGAQHAIALLARTLLSRGDRALVESPSYPHAIEALRGAAPDSSGQRLDRRRLGRARARAGVPAHEPDARLPHARLPQPDRAIMSPELRERTVALAARQGTTLIVDETMGELAIDGQRRPVPPFAVGRPRRS